MGRTVDRCCPPSSAVSTSRRASTRRRTPRHGTRSGCATAFRTSSRRGVSIDRLRTSWPRFRPPGQLVTCTDSETGEHFTKPRDPRRGDRVRHGAIVPVAHLAPPPERLQNFNRRRRRVGADVCREGWVVAAERIGASDEAARGPRNSARATPRRPALLIAVSRAPVELCRFDGSHMQRRFGCSGAEALLGSSRAWSTAIAMSPKRKRAAGRTDDESDCCPSRCPARASGRMHKLPARRRKPGPRRRPRPSV